MLTWWNIDNPRPENKNCVLFSGLSVVHHANPPKEAWNTAEALSENAGNPYKDRNGVWQCERDPGSDLVGAVLIQYCKLKGWTWS